MTNDSLIDRLRKSRKNIHDVKDINGFMLAMDIVEKHEHLQCKTIDNLEHMIKIGVDSAALLKYISEMRQFEAEHVNDTNVVELEISHENQSTNTLIQRLCKWQHVIDSQVERRGEAALLREAIEAIQQREISVVDGFDIEKARKDLKPEAWELLKQPVVQSLLYDINLLPEQIKTGKHWFYMLSMLSHMEIAYGNALKWESIDVLKWANSPQLEIMKDALIKIAAPLSPSPDEEDGTPTYTMVIDDYTKRVAIARQVLSDIEGGAP